MDNEDQVSQQMERLTVAAQNVITHWSDTQVRGHLKEHPDFVEHSLTLIEDTARTVRAAVKKERPDCGNVASGEPEKDFDNQVDAYRAHTCDCDYCYQQEAEPVAEPIFESFGAPAPEWELGQPYAGCSRNDLIYLLGLAKDEATETTNTIIAAAEAAASSGPDAAVAIIAQYVLDNGNVREPTEATDEQLAALTAYPHGPDGRFKEALNLWRVTWDFTTTGCSSAPSEDDVTTASEVIRTSIRVGIEQEHILQAARDAGEALRSDIAHFLPN